MEEILDSLPQIPKDLISFDYNEIQYLDNLLSKEPLTEEYIEKLIQTNRQQLKSIDEQIENLIVEIEPPPYELNEINTVFEDVKMLTNGIKEIETLVTKYVTEMRLINTSRLQIDTLQFLMACSTQFKEGNTDNISDLSYLSIIKPNIVFLQDFDEQISRQIANLAVKQEEADEIELPSHLQDAYEFWTTAQKKAELLMALNCDENFTKEITENITEEAFLELFDDSFLTGEFSLKLELFLRLHQEYMENFETSIIPDIAVGRMRYKDLELKYSEEINEKVHYTVKEMQENSNLFEEFSQFFAGKVMQKMYTLSGNCKIDEIVELLEIAKHVEDLLIIGSVKSGQIESIFQAREGEIIEYQLNNAVSIINGFIGEFPTLSQLKKSQVIEYFQVDYFQKFRNFDFLKEFELLPLEVHENQSLVNTFKQVPKIFISFFESQINLSSLVNIKTFKRSEFADFPKLTQGQVQPLIQLKSFACGCFSPVEYQPECEISSYFANLQKACRSAVQILTSLQKLLESKNYIVEFDTSEVISVEDTIELCAASIIAGRFCSFAIAADSATQIPAAREIYKEQIRQLLQEFGAFYDEYEMESFSTLVKDSFINSCAAAGLKFISTDQLLDVFIASIEDIFQYIFECETDQKLLNILTLRLRVLRNEQLTRKQFVAVMGQDAIDWWTDIAE